MSPPPVVAGVDVGGERKGCHLVILRGTDILLSTRSTDAATLTRHCVEHGARLVGVDAPCRWATQGVGRVAEKQLNARKLFVFSSPTREIALAHPTNFYGWMFNGERVFDALAAHYPLWSGETPARGVCFETFPHAITAALLQSEAVSARRKRSQRRAVLVAAGIDPSGLRSIDDVDAALCALCAQYLGRGQVQRYGEVPDGLIAVPQP
ncbi:DUF429 domain-containing protein [Silvimonas iriomotensis]|uniref:DUF429 domain-containing protein n=1 Tax=Silvimonas iriomotensis TaxID=449662 RepID=A0ABQ2PB26_9NEIS|nr:DUF429 domain-containing protein [Silvimonas iriomotensis]GGP22379.1 hypothetical protein GCM10010970_24940 [Silvimonas iriomotensis]